MKSTAQTPQEYLDALTQDRQLAMNKLRAVFLKNLPKGFEEVMGYGMLGYVVPFTLYPNGYHCDTSKPLPFINIASQKNFIVLHHLGLYGNTQLLEWFVSQYPKHSSLKIDMGKGCVRFKKIEQIPYDLIAELAQKISPKKWIKMYELAFNSHRNSKK